MKVFGPGDSTGADEGKWNVPVAYGTVDRRNIRRNQTRIRDCRGISEAAACRRE